MSKRAVASNDSDLSDVVGSIESAAKKAPLASELAISPRVSKTQRGDPRAALITRAEKRHESEQLHERARTGQSEPDGKSFLRLSAARLAEFYPHCYALNVSPAILGAMTAEQTAEARAALRPANPAECSVLMRAFVQKLKDQADAKS